MFSTRDLDISLGQIVSWNGQEASIRNIEAYTVALELESGEVVLVEAEELLNQNDDIVVLDN